MACGELDLGTAIPSKLQRCRAALERPYAQSPHGVVSPYSGRLHLPRMDRPPQRGASTHGSGTACAGLICDCLVDRLARAGGDASRTAWSQSAPNACCLPKMPRAPLGLPSLCRVASLSLRFPGDPQVPPRAGAPSGKRKASRLWAWYVY